MLKGQHILIDGTTKVDLDLWRITDVLVDLVKAIGMNLIGGPFVSGDAVYRCGLAIIAESHISLHIQELRFWLDIFSCKEFDPSPALQAVSSWGEISTTTCIYRGTSVDRSSDIQATSSLTGVSA